MRKARKSYEVVVRAYLWRLDSKARALMLAADIRKGCAWLPMESRWFIKTAVRKLVPSGAGKARSGRA